MSIDKESDGLPGINPRRRTTQINLAMIAAVFVFLAVTASLAVWIAGRPTAPADGRAPVQVTP